MLTWIDGRWHCDGVPIHAGSTWLLKCPDGELDVRIESSNQGRDLTAFTRVLGRDFVSRLNPEYDHLRELP